MLTITARLSIPLSEIEIKAVRSQGAGGQNVNKVSSAIHLRFDVRASSLPDAVKERLLRLHDQRLTRDGVLVIKAQEYRSQEQNLDAALERLRQLILRVAVLPKRRRPTQPTRSSQIRRLEGKTLRGRIKAARKIPAHEQ